MSASAGRTQDALGAAASVTVLVGVAFALFNYAVPMGNEWVYLFVPYRLAHPGLLANDWTLAGWGQEHLVFNTVVALWMRVASVETVGWCGRVLGWVWLSYLLLRLAGRFGLGRVAATAAVALWLCAGQSTVGGEWVLRSFEAKVVAYGFLLWGFHHLLDGREGFGGLLLGLSFSLHPSVGLHGGIAALGGLAATGAGVRRTFRSVAFMVLGGLPGAFFILPDLLASGASPDDWRVLVLKRMPALLDPFSFPKRGMAALILALIFNAVVAWRLQDRAIRFLAGCQGALAIVAAFGLVARALGAFGWLEIFPFRTLPVLALFALFPGILRVAREPSLGRWRFALLALGALAVAAPEHPAEGVTMALGHGEMDGRFEDDGTRVMRWVSQKTPQDAIVVAPPWRKDTYFVMRRSQVVSFGAPPYKRLAEWRRRTEALIGPIDPASPEPLDWEAVKRRYTALPRDRMLEAARRYGASLVVTPADYDLPLLFSSGEYKVYGVPPA